MRVFSAAGSLNSSRTTAGGRAIAQARPAGRRAAGVDGVDAYHDFESGVRDDRRQIPSYTSESRHAAAAVA